MDRKELLKGLTPEQIEKARSCKNNEELLELIRSENIELTDEQLEAVTGGCGGQPPTFGPCPMCNSNNVGSTYRYLKNFSRGGYDCECHDCGYCWFVDE